MKMLLFVENNTELQQITAERLSDDGYRIIEAIGENDELGTLLLINVAVQDDGKSLELYKSSLQ